MPFQWDYGQKAFLLDAVRDLVPFVQFKECRNTHGGVLFLVKFKAKEKL